MIPIELLIIPLRALLAALGTGELPAGAPAAQLRSTATVLDDARNKQVRINSELEPAWSGVGAARATSVLERAVVDAADFSDNSVEIADVIESAGEKVRLAARELQAILDSFVAVASAMGPSLYTAAGVTAIIPVAMAHLQRGVEVVERTRAELKADTDRLLVIGRTNAPAESDSVDAQLARVGTELGNLGNAAFGPIPAAGSTGPGAGGDPASTLPAGLSTTNPTGTGVAITLPDGSVAYAPNERAA